MLYILTGAECPHTPEARWPELSLVSATKKNIADCRKKTQFYMHTVRALCQDTPHVMDFHTPQFSQIMCFVSHLYLK